jgi:N-acylneuraminate cytidylyltransferase
LDKKQTIAIIPARGGSKRLPNKNIKLLGEVPLIAHSILYAKANFVDRVIVSTDNAEIKKVAIKYGAEVLDRPEELANDNSPTIEALIHVLKNINEPNSTIILLQPTNPLRPEELLKNALSKFTAGNFDSLMTVTRSQQKFGKIIEDKFVPYTYDIGQRSQDLDPLYFENGLLYITKSRLIEKGKILGKNNYPMIINHPYAYVDIDTKEDFELAMYYYQKKLNE